MSYNERVVIGVSTTNVPTRNGGDVSRSARDAGYMTGRARAYLSIAGAVTWTAICITAVWIFGG